MLAFHLNCTLSQALSPYPPIFTSVLVAQVLVTSKITTYNTNETLIIFLRLQTFASGTSKLSWTSHLMRGPPIYQFCNSQVHLSTIISL